RRNPMKSDELGWSRFTVSVNSAGAGWVAGGDTLRVPRRHAWVPSARRSEAVDQAPRPSVSPSGSGLIAAERDGLHLSRNGSSNSLRRAQKHPGAVRGSEAGRYESVAERFQFPNSLR